MSTQKTLGPTTLLGELRWLQSLGRTSSVRALAKDAGDEIEALRSTLKELAALVRGECPSLLDEDSGGDAGLSMRIDELLESNRCGL